MDSSEIGLLKKVADVIGVAFNGCPARTRKAIAITTGIFFALACIGIIIKSIIQ